MTAGKLDLNAFKDKIDNIHDWLWFSIRIPVCCQPGIFTID